MRISSISETNRREFMRRAGGTLLSTLIKKGVSPALAKSIVAAPAEHVGYVTVDLYDTSYGMGLDEVITAGEGLLGLLSQIGAEPIGVCGSDVVVSVNGDQLAKLAQVSDEFEDDTDELFGTVELPNGWGVSYCLSSDRPDRMTPTNSKGLLHSLWDGARKYSNKSLSGGEMHSGDRDKLAQYRRQYDLKPPAPKYGISRAEKRHDGSPSLNVEPIKRAPRNWDEFNAWDDEQKATRDEWSRDYSKWYTDKEELNSKRRERVKKNQSDAVGISSDYPGGMHQSFEERLRRALVSENKVKST